MPLSFLRLAVLNEIVYLLFIPTAAILFEKKNDVLFFCLFFLVI